MEIYTVKTRLNSFIYIAKYHDERTYVNFIIKV